MLTILRATDTNRTFSTGWSGPHLFAVSALAAGVTVALQWQANGTWVDVDATGSTAVTWTSNGQGRAVLAPGLRYRFLTSAVGPVVEGTQLVNDHRQALVLTGPFGITLDA